MARVDLIVVSILATVVVLIPLPWHWRARNVATLSMIFWLFIANFARIVNSIVWNGNIDLKYHVWCDISSKIQVGSSLALPAAALCICRHLASVASTKSAHPSPNEKRRRAIVEGIICWGIPIVGMGLHYIVQGHRFDIFEDLGCNAALYWSWPAIVIYAVPPLVMSAITFIYAAIALRFFIIRRLEFDSLLAGSASTLNTGRYLRLIGLAVTEMAWGSALGSYILYVNATDVPLQPYTNWDDVHADWWRVDRYPKALVPKVYRDRQLLSWWIVPASAFLFFAFFGFGQEAMAEYKRSFNWFRRVILRQTIKENSTFGSLGSLPPPRGLGTKVNMPAPIPDTPSVGYEPNWDLSQGSRSLRSDSFSLSRYTTKESDIELGLGENDTYKIPDDIPRTVDQNQDMNVGVEKR